MVLMVTPHVQVADAAEGKDFLTAGGMLQPDVPASHKLLGGAVTVHDPALYVDSSAKINNALNGAVLSATFLQYAPCLLSTRPYALGVSPTGIDIQPTGRCLTLCITYVCSMSPANCAQPGFLIVW